MESISRLRGRVFDVLVVVVAVLVQLEIVLRDLPGPRWLLLPAGLLYTLPLLLHDRWPFAAPTLAVGVQVLTSFVDVPGGARETGGVVAYVLAWWAFAAFNPLRTAILGLLGGLVGVVLVTVEDVRVEVDGAFSVALVGSLTWLAGVVLRQRSARAALAEEHAAALERDRREARAAVAEERARIARELHDVVAHSVSVMTVQAGAARMMLGADPAQAVAPLLAVEETGRQAMAELRRLLGVLRPEDTDTGLVPQPGLDDLPALAHSVTEAGLPVHMRVVGAARPLAPGVELAAYRIVQEALTNALRHARARQVHVAVDYGAEQLRLEVRDDGIGPSGEPAGHREPRGHGLTGMRERATVYGGQLRAGPEPGGGYAVRASLPIGRARS